MGAKRRGSGEDAVYFDHEGAPCEDARFHKRCRAVAGHGFALGGGNALLAHGLTARPTQDVDLFTDQEHGVQAISPAFSNSTTRAGV